MKHLLFCLLIITNFLKAQIDDKFIILDNDSSSSFNSDFNQKYQLFPQFTNLYQGFIVKPFERQGYYAWLQIKPNGSLRDTIIWMDDSFVQTLFSKLPNPQSELLDTDYLFIGRAKMLSFMNNRKEIKRNDLMPDLNIDSISIDADEFAKEYSKFTNITKKEDWFVKTTDLQFEYVALKGKIKNNLIVQRDDFKWAIDINNIISLKYKTASLWPLGAFLGIPTGAVVGGLLGTGVAGIVGAHGDGAMAGPLFGGFIGIFAGVLIGSIVFDKIGREPEIELLTTDYYDRYFELDSKTFFVLNELPIDTSLKLNEFTENGSSKILRYKEDIIATKEIEKQNALKKPQFSLGVGFFAPLRFNLNLLYFINDLIGVSYTGFPVPFELNEDAECSRFGLFYHVHSTKKNFFNIGLQVGIRNQSFQNTNPPYGRIFYKYSEAGAFCEGSIQGIFLAGGVYFLTKKLESNAYKNQIYFNMQFGYRYTF